MCAMWWATPWAVGWRRRLRKIGAEERDAARGGVGEPAVVTEARAASLAQSGTVPTCRWNPGARSGSMEVQPNRVRDGATCAPVAGRPWTGEGAQA